MVCYLHAAVKALIVKLTVGVFVLLGFLLLLLVVFDLFLVEFLPIVTLAFNMLFLRLLSHDQNLLVLFDLLNYILPDLYSFLDLGKSTSLIQKYLQSGL